MLYTYNICFNIQKIYILPTQYIFISITALTDNIMQLAYVYCEVGTEFLGII
jgi:hypothetical protein